MFEHLAKPYALKKAPSTVIPVGVSIDAAKEKYHLEHVIKLASNENPYGVSPKALQAMEASLQLGHLYPDSVRDNVLKAKLAEKYYVTPSNIMVTCGAANALSYVAEAFIKPGDECIITSPAYPPYYYNVYKNEGVIVDIPSRSSDMYMDIDAILAAITPKTRMIFICNPSNPTSTAYSNKVLLDFMKKLPSDVILVVDEAYIDFVDNYEGTTMMPYLSALPNMVVVQTFSKIYGLAGVRIGFSVAGEEIISCMNKAMAARSLSTIGIEGAIGALDDYEFRAKVIKNNTEQRRLLTKEFNEMNYKVYESQANFIYTDFGIPCQDLYFKLLPYGVMIRGDFPYARITIGTPEENAVLLHAIKDLALKGEI